MSDGLDQPDNPVDLALLALKKGDFAGARRHIAAFTETREALHYKIEGLACLAMADWPAARDVFSAATHAHADNAQFWFNRGLAEENLGQLIEAEQSYQHSLKLLPEQGEIFGNLSNVYRRLGKFPQAVQMACRAVASNVPKAHALNVLGLALGKQGNYSEAQKAFDEALLLIKDGAVLANRANIAVDQLKFDEAWGYFAAAREADDRPEIKRDEGMARLLAGDYTTGLPLYEARLELPNALRVHPSCPRWNGEDIKGKTLLLVSEQGFGDTIQFSRYHDRLMAMGADLLWLVRQPLQRLLAANLPGQVILEQTSQSTGHVPLPLAGGVRGGLANTRADTSFIGTSPTLTLPASGEGIPPVPVVDFWLPILSLPFALGMTSATAPTVPNFIAPTTPKLPTSNGKRKIGIVWGGSPTHERDHERSIALGQLAPLWKIDAQFFAPFRGAAHALKETPAPITPLDDFMHDFADTAALLAQLDCLITVDTAAAHLAGTLGIRTYLLLPYCPDWRWGAAGETTAWYPNMTLLRQPAYGDWASVVEKLVLVLP